MKTQKTIIKISAGRTSRDLFALFRVIFFLVVVPILILGSIQAINCYYHQKSKPLMACMLPNLR